jgi:alkylhydroperoxidase family enzyme
MAMWNGSDPPAAWIPVPSPDALPAEVAAEMGDVSARIGFVPNVARLLAVVPRHFVGWWRYFDDLMRSDRQGSRRLQREVIAVVISAEAQCPYCTAAHAAGYSDPDILYIVEVVAIFNYNVRLATATGLFPNPEYHQLGCPSAPRGTTSNG